MNKFGKSYKNRGLDSNPVYQLKSGGTGGGQSITNELVNYTPTFEILGHDTATSQKHMLLYGKINTFHDDRTIPITSWEELYSHVTGRYEQVLASGSLDGILDRIITLPNAMWMNDGANVNVKKFFSQGRITLPNWVPDDAIGLKIRLASDIDQINGTNSSLNFGIGPMSRHGQLGPYQDQNLDSNDGKIDHGTGENHFNIWSQLTLDPDDTSREGTQENTFDLGLDPNDRVLWWAIMRGNNEKAHRWSCNISMYIEGVYTRETYQTSANIVPGSTFTTYTPAFRLPGRENALEAENTLCFGSTGYLGNLDNPYSSGTLISDTFSTFTQFSGITDRYIQLPDLSFLVSEQASTHSSFTQGEISLPDWLPANVTGLRVRFFLNGNPRSNPGIAFGLFPLGQRSRLLGPYANTNINHATGQIEKDFLKKIGDYHKANDLMAGPYPFYGFAQTHLDPVGMVWKNNEWINSQHETEMYDTFDVAVDNTNKLFWSFYFGPHSGSVETQPQVMLKTVIEGVYTEENSYAVVET